MIQAMLERSWAYKVRHSPVSSYYNEHVMMCMVFIYTVAPINRKRDA